MNEQNACLGSSRPEPMESCRPSEPVRNTAREISINPLNHGYLVRVGCQSFAIENTDKLMKNIEAYLTNPDVVEKRWMGNKELL